MNGMLASCSKGQQEREWMMRDKGINYKLGGYTLYRIFQKDFYFENGSLLQPFCLDSAPGLRVSCPFFTFLGEI